MTGSNNSGLKRRFASRHIQDAECFRIPKNIKIFVSVAIENAFFTKRIRIIAVSTSTEVRRRRYINNRIIFILEPAGEILPKVATEGTFDPSQNVLLLKRNAVDRSRRYFTK